MIKCLLLSRPDLIEGPLHSTPLQINSQSIPRLDPIDSKSSLTLGLMLSYFYASQGEFYPVLCVLCTILSPWLGCVGVIFCRIFVTNISIYYILYLKLTNRSEWWRNEDYSLKKKVGFNHCLTLNMSYWRFL